MNLTQADIRFLCTALGFTAVAMQGKSANDHEGAQRAAAFADLIEEFCRTTLPEMGEVASASAGAAEINPVQGS